MKLGLLNVSETAETFLAAALSLDELRLRAVSHPAYADHAVTLWIAATDDYANPSPH
jgi:hypothetical protein